MFAIRGKWRPGPGVEAVEAGEGVVVTRSGMAWSVTSRKAGLGCGAAWQF